MHSDTPPHSLLRAARSHVHLNTKELVRTEHLQVKLKPTEIGKAYLRAIEAKNISMQMRKFW